MLDSEQLSDTAKLSLIHDLMIFEGSLHQALQYAKLYIELSEQLGDIEGVAQGWEELSLIYRKLGDISASTSAALRAQTIFKENGLIKNLAASHAQLASNLMLEGRYGESIKEYNKALKVYKRENDDVRACLTLLNIGESFRLAKDYDSAQYYSQESLRLNTSKNQIVHGYATGNLGLIYKGTGSLHKARSLLEESIEILTELGDLYSVSVYSFELGDILIKEGAGKVGESIMLQAYSTAMEEGLKEQIRDFSQSLSEYYESRGAFEKSLRFQKQYQFYKDSLINIDNVRKVEQLKAQNEVNQREAEISLLNQESQSQRQVVTGLSAGTFVLILLLGLLYQSNRQKKRANAGLAQREKEKALLLQELNHRTKNNLQMISSLLNLQSISLEDHPAAVKVREGRYRVDSLALIHQKLYQDGYKHLNMQQYLQELIKHLCVGFNPLIKVECSIVPCSMKVDQAIPVALIVNELMTNALKYGFDPNNSVHQIWVTLQKQEDEFRLRICDNGPGMNPPDVASLPSFGLQLVYSLVEQLEGAIQFESKNGTHWEIRFI